MKTESEIKRARFILMDHLKNDFDKLREKINSQINKEEKGNVSQYENMIKEINEKSNCDSQIEQISGLLSEAAVKLELGLTAFSKGSKIIEKRNDNKINFNNDNNNKINDSNSDLYKTKEKSIINSNSNYKDSEGFSAPKVKDNFSKEKISKFDSKSPQFNSVNNNGNTDLNSNSNSLTCKKNSNFSPVIPNNNNINSNHNDLYSNNQEINSNNFNYDNSNLSFSNINNNSNSLTNSNAINNLHSGVINNNNNQDTEMSNLSANKNTENFEINPSNCFFLAMKSRPNNEIVYFDLYSKSLKTLTIQDSNYNPNSSICKTSIFPYENSKYINIGNGLLVTGGNVHRAASDHVFRLNLTKEENGEKLQITRYSNMSTKRERHNILFIERLNIVIVCAGFYTNKCEYTNLNDQRWIKLPDMSGNRGNGTLFSVNQKYVYCLGGFRVNESAGIYLNNLEFLDIEEQIFRGNLEWNTIDLKPYSEDMKISAMGVIEQKRNCLILLGGYDGSKYLKESWEINFDENFNLIGLFKNENKASLFKGSVFFSNPVFMKVTDDLLLNFELQAKPIWYSKNNLGFIEKNPFLQEDEINE